MAASWRGAGTLKAPPLGLSFHIRGLMGLGHRPQGCSLQVSPWNHVHPDLLPQRGPSSLERFSFLWLAVCSASRPMRTGQSGGDTPLVGLWATRGPLEDSPSQLEARRAPVWDWPVFFTAWTSTSLSQSRFL